jgi:hypothetical protein
MENSEEIGQYLFRVSVKRRKRHGSAGFFGFPPYLSPEAQGVWWRTFGILSVFSLIRSGIRPQQTDPTAWYDRILRVLGGLIVLSLMGVVVVILIRDGLRGFK